MRSTRVYNNSKILSLGYKIQSHDILFGEERYALRVKDLPEEDRPREKLILQGPAVLSIQELLAVVLQTGTKKEEVLTMTSRILKEYGEKTIIHEKNPSVLAEELNIPLTKACQIIASFELGRRLFKNTKGGAVILRTPKQVFEHLKDMRDLPKEQLRGLYLNSRYQLIHDEVISIGTLTSSIIHPREIFRPAIEYSAAAIIIAHNHPSGGVKPTEADIRITRQLIKAGELLGIDLLDHIIIAHNKYTRVLAP